MSRSFSVVTGFDQEATVEQIENNDVLKLQNNLIVYAPHRLEEQLLSFRKQYDPDLTKTHVMFYFDNTDAKHLYNENLVNLLGDDKKQIQQCLLKLNRLAFIRDMGMVNPFKTSHFLWIDADVKLPFEKVENYELCVEKVVHFIDNDGIIDDRIFIVPQEMAWAYYYWNKLEHRETIHSHVLLPFNQYFEILNKKLDSIIEVKIGSPFDILSQNKDFVPLPVEDFDKTLTVVVNHYQHDTSWVSRLNHPVSVYNKNPNDTHLFELNLPNVGFDTIVYLRFIIDNYDNLPDYMCFLQDDPFFHCMDTIQIVNNFKFDREFVPMSTSYYLGGHDWKMSEDYAARVGLEFVRPLKMITSCQCIVSKKLVLQRKKEFYELLVSTIDQHVKSSENYAIENLWPTILGFNEELVPCLNCRGYGDKQ